MYAMLESLRPVKHDLHIINMHVSDHERWTMYIHCMIMFLMVTSFHIYKTLTQSYTAKHI